MNPPAISHTHDVAIGDALDFIDTLELEHGEPFDHFVQPADMAEWLHDHGLLHDASLDPAIARLMEPGPAATRALARVRQVRAALRELVDATVERRPPVRSAVDVVNQAMRAHQRLVLVAGEDGVSLDHRHEGDPLDDALARIAERVAREVSGDRADRLRICDNDTCRWVFFDSSPTGRRRWCDMATCGNRAKAARHRARAKAGELGGTEVPAASA
ncbi:MAG TPA: CGNR zinc finger domain-containing protein [Candidatus Limnocylindria bacterium]|nr:CGNR zinc finger domain-containing protein [Candidatus Limnocylindria bacterium]